VIQHLLVVAVWYGGALLLSPPLLPSWRNKAIGLVASARPVSSAGARHRQRALRGCGRGYSTEAKGERLLKEGWSHFLRATGAIHRHRAKSPKGVSLLE